MFVVHGSPGISPPPFFPFSLPSIPFPLFSPPYCVNIITFTSLLTTDTWTPTHNIFLISLFCLVYLMYEQPQLLPSSHIFTDITLSPSNLSYHPFYKIDLSPHPHSPPPITSSIYIPILHFNTISPHFVLWWLFLKGVHHTLHVQHLNPTSLSTTPSGHNNFTNGLSSHWDQ